MNEKWLKEKYKKVKAKKQGTCKGCVFIHCNREMGYDFCEEIPCYPHIYKRRLPKWLKKHKKVKRNKK